jgi:hypothetical protein
MVSATVKTKSSVAAKTEPTARMHRLKINGSRPRRVLLCTVVGYKARLAELYCYYGDEIV